jgi:hypothetical protein
MYTAGAVRPAQTLGGGVVGVGGSRLAEMWSVMLRSACEQSLRCCSLCLGIRNIPKVTRSFSTCVSVRESFNDAVIWHYKASVTG